eukprot:3945878-Amphidinium_carterae.3
MRTSVRTSSYVLRRAWFRRRCASIVEGHMVFRVAIRMASGSFSSNLFFALQCTRGTGKAQFARAA